jgi:uncharacterized iron-regulated membrane protein
MQTISTIILAVLAALSVGALIVGYALWRERRRADDAQQAEAKFVGGGGGPKEPA